MPTVRTPEAPCRPLATTRRKMLPSPLGDGVGHSNHDRFRGYLSVHLRSGLQFPCLRFATAVTGRHARLGTRLLARPCRGCHFRRLCLTSFQAQPPQIRTCGFCRIRLLDRQLRYAPSRTRWSGSQAMATAIPTACLASSAIRCRDVETGPNLEMSSFHQLDAQRVKVIRRDPEEIGVDPFVRCKHGTVTSGR